MVMSLLLSSPLPSSPLLSSLLLSFSVLSVLLVALRPSSCSLLSPAFFLCPAALAFSVLLSGLLAAALVFCSLLSGPPLVSLLSGPRLFLFSFLRHTKSQRPRSRAGFRAFCLRLSSFRLASTSAPHLCFRACGSLAGQPHRFRFLEPDSDLPLRRLGGSSCT
jgi:hypothetical protein